MPAISFDLDETLLDASMLQEDRFGRVSEVSGSSGA